MSDTSAGSSRSRRRSSASKAMFSRMQSMEIKLDHLETNMELVLGGIAILLGKPQLCGHATLTMDSTMAAPTMKSTSLHSESSFSTPPHHISCTMEMGSMPVEIPSLPFPNIQPAQDHEDKPVAIDMRLFIDDDFSPSITNDRPGADICSVSTSISGSEDVCQVPLRGNRGNLGSNLGGNLEESSQQTDAPTATTTNNATTTAAVHHTPLPSLPLPSSLQPPLLPPQAVPYIDDDGFLDNVSSSESGSMTSESDPEPLFEDPEIQAEYIDFLQSFLQGRPLPNM